MRRYRCPTLALVCQWVYLARPVKVIVARADEVAGLAVKVHPHQLTRSGTPAAFVPAEKGTDTRLIQDYLGHRSIANTVIDTETSARRRASVRVR
jgi:site-specific recombinase XerD